MAELHALPTAPKPPSQEPPKRKRRPSQTWRQRFAYDAGCEVSAIAQCLLRECPDPDGDLVRALAMRLEALSCIITSAEDDDEGDVAAMLVGPVEAGKMIRKGARRA